MIDAETLRRLMQYDPITGEFSWAVTLNQRAVKGRAVAGADKYGYLRTKIGGKCYFLHRLAWLYMTGEHPTGQIDHIDNNKKNNRFANLRVVNGSQNQQNKTTAPSHNKSSGLLGASWNKERKAWRAYITVKRKQLHLGFFASAGEAHNAYMKAKAVHHAWPPA